MLFRSGVEQARPGIISALTGHGRLNDGFRQALDQAIKDRTQPMNIQQQLEQQAAVKALRNKYQLPDNATPEQVRENMAKYFYEASRMGLPIEGMGGAAAEAMRGINERDMPFSTVNAGDELYSFNKKTGTFTPGPQTGISADAMEMKRLELELKRQQIAATIAMKNNSNTEREQKRLDGLRNQFMNQNRDIVNSARGIEIAREAFDQLRSGNVAAFKSAIINFAGTVDVVVTDGFTGNIALKTAEGTARLIGAYLRSALKRSLISKLGAVIASGALQVLRRKLDPRAQSGGVFLGLNGIVVKSHGGADAVGFASAVDTAIDMARADINARITRDRSRITAKSAGARAGEL